MNLKLMSIVLCAAMGSTLVAQSFNDEPLKAEVGVTAGNWFEGQINVGAMDATKKGSFILCAFVDYYVAPKFAVGLYASLSPGIGIEEDDDMKAKGTEIGMSLKPRIPIGEKIAIKPGLLIGYRKLKPDDKDIDHIIGLGINASIEVQYQYSEKVILFVQPGFYAQPVGGNDDIKVDFPPIGYFAAGISIPFF